MSVLQITDVRVRPYAKADDKLKAFASLTIADCFVVTDLKVIQGKKGLFVAMPSRKRRDGTFKDVAHPLNQVTRDTIERMVLEAYDQALAEGKLPVDSDGDLHEDLLEREN
jgi:stage V sporulation protein G